VQRAAIQRREQPGERGPKHAEDVHARIRDLTIHENSARIMLSAGSEQGVFLYAPARMIDHTGVAFDFVITRVAPSLSYADVDASLFGYVRNNIDCDVTVNPSSKPSKH
jgi:hypothetical protein